MFLLFLPREREVMQLQILNLLHGHHFVPSRWSTTIFGVWGEGKFALLLYALPYLGEMEAQYSTTALFGDEGGECSN